MMARYNRWQNASLLSAADGLDEAARQMDRGAFFGSIHATLAHVLWADSIWLYRLASWNKPGGVFPGTTGFADDWDDLCIRRRAFDDRLADWAASLDAAWLAGDLIWTSASAGGVRRTSRWSAVVHLFNHQTHHRGQVHAMLTAAGARPDDTDLLLLPADA